MDYIIETCNIDKSFNGKKVLSNLSIHVKKGDIYGFIGANGAGKTTAMKIILGLLNPSKGIIKLYGSEADLDKSRSKIGSLIEAPGLYLNKTAKENMRLFSLLFKTKSDYIDYLLKFVGLDNTNKKKVGAFSLGMKQRLGIAIALLGNPEILVLDEPINGLDPAGIVEIRNLLLKLNKERGMTILISSHILGELSKVATTYGIITKGVLVEEISSEDIDNFSNETLLFKVSDSPKAIQLLKDNNISNDVSNEKDIIFIKDSLDKSQEIIKLFIDNNIEIIEFSHKKTDIEKYFVDKMEGKHE